MLRVSIALALLLLAGTSVADQAPASLLRLPESTPTVFIAETSASAFHRFDRTDDGVVKVRQDYMSIGLAGVRKESVGDQRTPLGVYFVTEQLDTTKLHEKYGVTAFPLDYPNAWDQRLGRTGDGIWVHGVDRKGGARPRRDTDGCIALPNKVLLELEPAFLPNTTPVLITTKLEWLEAGSLEERRSALEQAVMAWGDSLQKGDMYTWLDLYDESFEHRGMDKAAWSTFSMETVGRREINAVDISDLMLLGDPGEEGLYFSRFRLEISEKGGREVLSMRRMHWRRSESGAFRIVAEDSG
jgi:hypothetical protein